MIYVELPDGFAADKQRLPFFLAMEEWLARQRHGEYFFMWQADPTVIFGRNQIPQVEADLPFCHSNGIALYRRKSGGGCVFADRNNIMFSHITTSGRVAETFAGFTGAVAAMLRSLGFDASASGRNDILIGQRKVSGYAFYNIHLPRRTRAVVHGTMLVDADKELMERALTPSAVKISAKGVASVRSRITTLREHAPVELRSFMDYARHFLCDSSMKLTDGDIDRIRDIERQYYSDLAVTACPACAHAPQRIEGVGEFSIDLRLDDGTPPRIGHIDITGDFFITADFDAAVTRPLTGCKATHADIERALTASHPETAVPGLTPGALAEMIMRQVAETAPT